MVLKGYVLSVICVFGIIGAVTVLHRLFKFNGEIARKLIHSFVGFTWFPMYFYLRETVHLIVVPLIFTAVNWLSVKFNIFKSMEREKSENSSDFGTVYYAICMVLLSVFTYFFRDKIICYGIAVFCLSFGDGAAAIAGTLIKKHNIKIMKGRTLAGTLACFIAATFGVYFVCTTVSQHVSLWQALVFGIATALLELIGGKLDNFAVSLGVMLTACLML